jgi:hypothetical protein
LAETTTQIDALVGALRLGDGQRGAVEFSVRPRWELASLAAPGRPLPI